jgi:hypothetical protein
MLGGRDSHLKIAVRDAGSLPHLPVYTSWNVGLTGILVCPVHRLHVEDEVAYLAIEIALVDVPFCSGDCMGTSGSASRTCSVLAVSENATCR